MVLKAICVLVKRLPTNFPRPVTKYLLMRLICVSIIPCVFIYCPCTSSTAFSLKELRAHGKTAMWCVFRCKRSWKCHGFISLMKFMAPHNLARAREWVVSPPVNTTLETAIFLGKTKCSDQVTLCLPFKTTNYQLFSKKAEFFCFFRFP